MRAIHRTSFRYEICILAGGLSSRMGRDKSRLRLGGKTLLAHVRAIARRVELPIRIIRRDLVPRCGPLGGIYTALVTGQVEAVLFLSCDMPFVSPAWIRELLARMKPGTNGLFVRHDGVVGFPFLLNVKILPQIELLRAQKQFSLQCLAKTIQAETIRPSPSVAAQLFNINTREEWRTAGRLWKQLQDAPQRSAVRDTSRTGGKRDR